MQIKMFCWLCYFFFLMKNIIDINKLKNRIILKY